MFPSFYGDMWVGHSCRQVLEGMRDAGAEISLTVLSKRKDVHSPYVQAVVPRQLLRFVRPILAKPARLVGRRLASKVRPGDLAYIWLDGDAELVSSIRARGGFVVREMINCTVERRGRELRRAYELLGWPDQSGATAERIQNEKQALVACDAVFCPNPHVRESVMAYGVRADACIDVSYGWSPLRIRPARSGSAPDDGVTVAFVGTVDVRKGTPWLLRAWAKAKIRGRLLLAGEISPEVAQGCAALLNEPGVSCLGHVGDVNTVYAQADIFVFPTWEEGGPLVTLEAMAYGLPCVVTPMGTSGVLTDEHGIVVPAGDVDAMADALQKLAADRELRRALGEAGRVRVQEFTWEKVGRRRLEGVRQRWEQRR